jgi:thiamine transporter ThiT
VTTSTSNPAIVHEPLSLGDVRLYLTTAAMVLGNVLLPYAVHSLPNAGRMLMPIFFFTLVAGWRFGLKAGLLTAILSPLANHFLTGMPPTAVLQTLILQSALLGVLAASTRGRRATLPLLALVVLAHQALTLVPVLAQAGAASAFAAFRLHLPGILLMVLGGFALLRALEPRREA